MKKLIALLISIILLCSFAFAEEIEEDWTSKKLYVTATLLNGRATPSKKATVEARFDKYDIVKATGEWSKNHEWVEVCGGETGTVWCAVKYLSEITQPVIYRNMSQSKIKIRKKPFNGTVVKYLKPNKTIEILQIVNGWGRSKSGWIDISYLVED